MASLASSSQKLLQKKSVENTIYDALEANFSDHEILWRFRSIACVVNRKPFQTRKAHKLWATDVLANFLAGKLLQIL